MAPSWNDLDHIPSPPTTNTLTPKKRSSAFAGSPLLAKLPALLILLGNLALFFYPLNQKQYAEVQAAISKQ